MVDLDGKLAVRKPSVFKKILQWIAGNSQAIWAELLSSAMLLFLGCMSCVSESALATKPPMYSAWGFGLTVLFNVQIFGHISGCHMNPAVTISAVILGYTSVALGIVYILAQCIGCFIGFYLLSVVSPIDLMSGICVTVPIEGLNEIQSVGIEIGLTTALCLLCCATWDHVNAHKQDSSAVKFGLAVAGLSIIGGPLTGASMNPARSLGPAIVTGIWRVHYIYWTGPIIGSVLAPLIYKTMVLKTHTET